MKMLPATNDAAKLKYIYYRRSPIFITLILIHTIQRKQCAIGLR